MSVLIRKDDSQDELYTSLHSHLPRYRLPDSALGGRSCCTSTDLFALDFRPYEVISLIDMQRYASYYSRLWCPLFRKFAVEHDNSLASVAVAALTGLRQRCFHWPESSSWSQEEFCNVVDLRDIDSAFDVAASIFFGKTAVDNDISFDETIVSTVEQVVELYKTEHAYRSLYCPAYHIRIYPHEPVFTFRGMARQSFAVRFAAPFLWPACTYAQGCTACNAFACRALLAVGDCCSAITCRWHMCWPES